MDLKGRDYFS